jgi:type IV pilus assembly protein PilY1
MKHFEFRNSWVGLMACALLSVLPSIGHAQTVYTENFTGGTTSNQWYFVNGACLTAGTTFSTTSPGLVPACNTASGAVLPYYKTKGDSTLYGGNSGTLPDTSNGALRFTNGYPGGYSQNGAIISDFTFPTTNGLQITFTTETYRGNSYVGTSADGADGLSFFLQAVTDTVNNLPAADLGDYGGSLGYTCSNTNNDGTLRPSGQPRGYDGLIGGYLGLGIDEFGNFLNPGDNTSTGPGFQGNRIGLRGPGSTAWAYLNATYPTQYPSTLNNTQRASAVQQACKNGYVYDWSAVGAWNTNGGLVAVTLPTGGTVFLPGSQPTPTTPYQAPTTTNGVTTYAPIALPNYAVVANGYKLLGTKIKIANESALYRGNGTAAQSSAAYGVPITYNLTITPKTPTSNSLLSLSYSYNGGVFQPVISGQDLQTTVGTLPANVRFGFAGSTGGGTNIHEIMCFQAQPSTTTGSSAGINQKQSAKVQIGSQVYFAFYNTNNWPGSLTSQNLVGSGTPLVLTIDPVANWDASCVLTGIALNQTCASTGVSGVVAPQAPSNRTILTWNGTQGIPFEWANLTSAQQAALDTGDSTVTANRLNYLRGDRTNELTPQGVGLYRARTSVLGDIIDSSPTWVGPPSAGYANTWSDALISSASLPENASSAQTYSAFTSAYATRTNVVYAGANDGLLHGFRAGSYTASNTYVNTYNDGQEQLAYMPGYIVNNINASANTTNDYSNPQYSHRFDVDATPGTGDLFYGNQWHTWIVGGLGPGGNAIYALDVTNPGSGGTNNFSESGAAAQSTVIGEWSTTTTSGVTTSTISCANVSACGNNLGKTFGTPQIRRFHNGNWGFIVGNGLNSVTGDAGIYVVTVDSTSGAMTWYYLSTGKSGSADGIAFPAAEDLDGDNITDYVYAGDVLGNVWRFDLTSNNPSNWAVTAGGPLFTTPSGQPITTKVVVVLNNSGPVPRVLVEFGTGQQIPVTNTSAALYSTGQQALYGIWDWNFSAWNLKSNFDVASLPLTPAPTGALFSNLVQQTITGTYGSSLSSTGFNTTGNAYRTVSSNPVCYADTNGCTNYGWYLNLYVGPASTVTGAPVVSEQILFAPALLTGVFFVNTTIPPTNTPTICTSTTDSSWTMALDPLTGGALPSSVFQDSNLNFINVTTTNGTLPVSGEANAGTGTPTLVIYNNQSYLVSAPNSGTGTGVATGSNVNAVTNNNIQIKRLMWIERR